MSQENVEIVRRSFEAWNAGDVQAIRRFYAEDALVETIDGLTKLGEAYKGDDPVGRWFADVREAWDDAHWQIERIFDGEDVVVSLYRATGVGRMSGAEVSRGFAGVYRIRDGKIASERVYLDLNEALEAAGLSE